MLQKRVIMEKLTNLIVGQKKRIVFVFLMLAVICIVLQLFVHVNYNMVDYLPSDAQSTTGLAIMGEEFDTAIPNANVMIRDVSLMEAVSWKKQLMEVEGVTQVMWLDDMINLQKPLETSDPGTVETFYKDSTALYQITIEEGMEQEVTAAIQEKIGEKGAIAGEAPTLAAMQSATVTEVLKAMAILLPIILCILLLSTTSFLEPLLFLLTIGVSILINMGTNVFLGSISFMTSSISPILQLACSLDYSIFLLHSFGKNRKKFADVNIAMKESVKESMSTVAASAMTTLFGFLALVFMDFQIGADLGINLAKGIVLSFAASMLFLPAITLCLYKWIDKTAHKPWMPHFRGVYRILSKFAVPVVILVALLTVPAFLGQGKTGFVYGNDSATKNSRAEADSLAIEEVFGKNTIVVLLVPRGDLAKEDALCKDIQKMDNVTGIMSYTETVGTGIPPEYLGEDVSSQFMSPHYSRIIVYSSADTEGDTAFQTVEQIQSAAREYYGDEVYSVGESVSLYDMKQTVEVDNTVVNLIAIAAIFLVLLVTFRSLTLPFILLLTIEAGIWINLSIPYFTGTSIHFIGYLVLSTVQLGATVDYAILLTGNYMRSRKTLPKKESAAKALQDCFQSILVSGATLATAGFTLYATSSNSSISDIGLLLGRGTLFSMIMVVCFLPAMLRIFDTWIGKTTRKANFAHIVSSKKKKSP